MTAKEADAVFADALERERQGRDWAAKHVMAVFEIARSTVYDTHWIMRASRVVGRRSRRWNPKELRAAQLLATARAETRGGFRS